MEDLLRLRRRQQRHSSKLRLAEASPSSFRKLFQCSPSGFSYSRSLSLLFADLKTLRRAKGSDYDPVNRPIRAPGRTKADNQPSQRLKVIPRSLSPLQHTQPSELLCKQGADPSRSQSQCSKSGLEVSFITLDLEPGRYRPERRRTKHLDQLPLVYLAKLPAHFQPSTPKSPSFPESPTPPPLIKRTINRLKHISETRPLVSLSGLKQPAEVSSLGPWLDDYS
jgi:hypothetical protein